MGKRSKKSKPAATADGGAGARPVSELAPHSAYFNSLVELVPAKHYVESKEPVLNLKYMKKAERAEAKRALKETYRKNKRAKLDPDAAQTVADVQRAQAQESAREADGDGAAGPSDAAGAPPRLNLQSQTGTPASLEELRQRLQLRLQNHRQQRHADEKQLSVQKAKDWRSKSLGKQGKQKKQHQKIVQPPASRAEGSLPAEKAPHAQSAVQVATQESAPAAAAIVPESISFGRVRVPIGDTGKRKKKASKSQLLDAARQNSLMTPSSQEAWNKALARAQGNKVYDDPKLLQRTVKREQKVKEKKAKAWKDRIGKQNSERKAKQKKRQGNLQARANTKMQNKKDKREKKLARPGFEGRRDTPIN